MELRQLRYALAVATHRHFTKAAASVPVAQPALSHQIKLLEQELGLDLFERSRGGVRLTDAGDLFLVRARRALAEVDAAQEEIAALKGLTSGRLVLGAMQALAGLDLPRLLSAFHTAHPGIEVSLREDLKGPRTRCRRCVGALAGPRSVGAADGTSALQGTSSRT